MSLQFRHKVFVTLLLNSLLIVICSLLIARYLAQRHFEDYIGKMEMERLGELADLLSQEYQRNGSWVSVLDDPGRWHWITMIGLRHHPKPMGAGFPSGTPPSSPPFGQDPKWREPPPHDERFSVPPPHSPRFDSDPRRGEPPAHDKRFAPPPPPPYSSRFERDLKRGEPPQHDKQFSGPPGPPPDHEEISSQVVLFDAEKHPLTTVDSASTEAYQMKPISVEDKVVGWVGIRRFERPTHPLDTEFTRDQSRTFYAVGGIAVLMAIAVTFLFSRHLLAPVKELAEGTRALTSRRFDTRLKVRSKDEFGQLASDFNDMAQALGRHEEMQRQWIADISHELRTPLAILRGEIEAMQDGVREVTSEALESLLFEVLHLSRIVHDLHDLSLIESQAYAAERTMVNPLDILEETLRSFHSRFADRGLNIERGDGGAERVTIMADTDRLRQLFSNLLENTLRYADAPGTLKVVHQLKDDSLLLSFEDSGPGVPEESLDRLFDRLYRVDQARSRGQGGSGLGLAICRSIVESFRGRIEASNGSTGGLKIVVIFPRVENS